MGDRHPIAAGLTVLANILEREKARGASTMSLRPETESALQSMPLEFMKLAALPKTSTDGEVPSGSSSRGGPSSGNVEEIGNRTEKWAREQLNSIFREVKGCTECRQLGTLRETIVFASGNPMADLMFVGEAPGVEEEKARKPFVGESGKKLDQIVKVMGLDREAVYFSNIVKFRPKKGDGRFQGTSDRKPDATEMSASIKYIRAEIEVIRPKVIVALGATAAEGLLEVGGAMSSLRGATHEFAGVPVIVTYHPSFLLRQEGEGDPAKAMAMKRRVWEDMLRVMELLEMPISDKQRGFFL